MVMVKICHSDSSLAKASVQPSPTSSWTEWTLSLESETQQGRQQRLLP